MAAANAAMAMSLLIFPSPSFVRKEPQEISEATVVDPL
jgi:hypothetical protein